MAVGTKGYVALLASVAAMACGSATFGGDGDAARANLIPNGGFETDADGNGLPDGWSLDGKGAWKLDRDHAFAGKACVTTETLGNTASLFVPVRENEAYRFGLGHKSDGRHMLRLTWLTKARKNIPSTVAGKAFRDSAVRFSWGSTGGKWRRFSRDLLAPPEAGILKLFVENRQDAALALDDVSLVALGPLAVPKPADEGILFQEGFDGAALMQANHGAFSPDRGAAVEFVDGRTGRAMRCLDTDGACRYPAFGRIDMTKGSMECWLQTSGAAPAKVPGRFMPHIFEAGFIRVQFYPLRKGGKPAKGIMVMARKDGGRWGRYTTLLVDQWEPAEWHHLAVTWQVGEAAAEVRVYVDGARVKAFTFPVRHGAPGRPKGAPLDTVVVRQPARGETFFAVGAAHTCRPEFAYAIDDLRIWDSARSFAAPASKR